VIAKETVREEIWIRAYEARFNKDFINVTAAVNAAEEVLAAFDRKFPVHTQNIESPF
jgi:hypothetical protein